jgi:hypothetical protein
MKAAAESNLKVVTLELGGKSPTIVFDDVDVAEVAQKAAFGVLYVVLCYDSGLSNILISFVQRQCG